jgi:cytochrome bd-type quinol oxidase subunit 2
MRGANVGLKKTSLILALIFAAGLPVVLAEPAFAQAAGVSNVENFIRNVITVLAGLAGLVATGFFVVGGFTYITSSGNPEQLDKAKRTLTWSAIGLAIVIAAFVLANIVTTLAKQAFGS